ncbi:MAG: hypothetical protein IMZ50_03055 [Candidatus Atribacteria bacterium]|nr:hypothetical protein [Candidatus Atribacteria bacterium]
MNDLRIYYSKLESIPQAKWDSLSRKKIYFGHQSVGQNIIDGIKDVMGHNSAIRLDIRETSNPSDFASPLFAHSLIGQNMDPKSKIDDFRKILENGVGQVTDIAMFKFCYVDIDRNTDIESLFKYYNNTITNLEVKYPSLRIITFSVPLTNMPKGFKPLIKKMLGMTPPFKDDNIKKNIYNQKLRDRFGKSVFDLADAESALPGGKRAIYKVGNETYNLLNPAFTDDGGHLNRIGKQVVAVDLLLFLLNHVKS